MDEAFIRDALARLAATQMAHSIALHSLMATLDPASARRVREHLHLVAGTQIQKNADTSLEQTDAQLLAALNPLFEALKHAEGKR